MTEVVLRCVETTGCREHGSDPSGAWLASFDPEARDGWGEAAFTFIPGRAKRFGGAAQALEFVRQVPQARPRRPDGRPNRPLTAYTFAVEGVPGE